jgi:Amt family ammonium transporter
LDTGNTAWILTSTALVTLMFPGLAFYYAGMTGFKTTLNMLMMVTGAFCTVIVVWVLVGYSITFGDSVGGLGLVGDPTEYLGLTTMLTAPPDANGLPPLLVSAFMGIFAALTTSIIAGVAADRMKFGSWIAFAALWSVFVYGPVAHWVFAFDGEGVVGGWIVNQLGGIDFAGGTAVHINSGAAGLALCLVLGRRLSWDRPPRPHSLPLTLLGTGLLWAGWFGFNGGSALAAGQGAGAAVATTLFATAAAALGWALVEKIRYRHATALGTATGAIAGLVAITPACGALDPIGSLILGVLAGALCCFAVTWKRKLGYDDSLDVVGVHFVGGIFGTLMIGVLSTSDAPNATDGLAYGGGLRLLGVQLVAALAVIAYSFIVSFAIAKLLALTVGLRAVREDEETGLDQVIHAETAYEIPAIVRD